MSAQPAQIPQLLDHRGTPIVIGAKVAFNYSGEIGVGRVKAIKQGYRYNQTVYTFEIERDFPKGHYGSQNPISKVRNQHNLLVLFEN